MDDVTKYLQSEKKRFKEQAKAITAKASEEDRGLTDEERSEVEHLIEKTAGLDRQIMEREDNERLLEAIEGVGDTGGTPTVAPKAAKTAGEAFTKSEGYKALIARGLKGRFSTGPVEFGSKAVTDGGSPDNPVSSTEDAGGSLPLQPQVLPIVGPVEQKLYVADLFGSGVATQNSIVYLEETTTDPGALDDAYTAANMPASAVVTDEGDAKPAAYVNFTKRSASIEKIAAFLPVSDEMLEDEPAIASYIDGRLPLFVKQAEEAYVMGKLATAISGNTADNTDVDGDATLFDAIAAGILKVQVDGGLEPDGVLINPTDFWKMSVTKASPSGAYQSGGPYAGPARNPWGLRTVVTSAVTAGSPIVGAFASGGTVWRKGGLSVEASNSHADYFIKNLTALRAEERLALVVIRPEAFCTVSVVS